jgi:CDP-glucose 4,6-dehydratase
MVRALLGGKPLVVRNPDSVRPWQHVLEPLSGYLTLCERLVAEGPAVAEGWNFGPAPDDARPVSWIADRLTSLWGEGASWSLENAAQPHEAEFLHLDTAKARQRLGYRPRWNLDRGLDATTAWAKRYRDNADMREVTLGQIDDFMDADIATAARPMNLQGA